MRSDLYDLLRQRRSTRAFTSAPVDRSTIARLCTAARRAPSGANLQPGKFHALAGNELDALSARLVAAAQSGMPTALEYSYFPERMSPTHKDRQRKAGFALYEALGISRRDIAGRRAQFDQNYRFFDAPVGIVVTIDRDMGKGCFMDLGMSIMALLLAAEAEGLGATGIGALANYGAITHDQLGLDENELVVCGIAIGHADPNSPVNQFRTERAALSEFASFRGFDD
ncbi:nitroreductase [Loktanella sp. S4079]|uniref:nitroreductase n=1 Tax=Loktanella sp. S4079 TaxID=579483 RepID=UPI0005FA79D6|nr:nitroreductase [Loktanella sp. S4079]KJZ19176.1 oxidoreductase [Loktanella sp. S4079]